MRFKKITIENFKSIGDNPITINLDFNKTTLLLGQNGAGKTTIFDAIVWCIYGVTKLKADNVVNKFIGSGTKVELEFSENRHDYVITRYRKHSVHKNNLYVFEDGNNITLKNPTDNQDLVQRIVGLDSRAFMSSIVLSSETYKQFLRETNSIRLQIFESVFNLRELNELAKINKQDIKELENSINNKTNELNSINSFIISDTNALKAYKENYDNTIKNFDAQIEKANNIIKEYTKALSEIDNIDFDAETKKAIEYQTIIANYNNSKQLSDNLNSLLNTQEKQYVSYKTKLEQYDDIIKNHSTEELKLELEKIKELEKQKAEFDKLSSEISELRAKVKEQTIVLENLESNIKKLDDEIWTNKRALTKLELNICPTCGNHMSDDSTESLKKEYENNIIKLSEERAGYDLSLTAIKSEFSDITFRIHDLVNEQENYKFVEPKYTYEEIKSIASKLKEATENYSETKESLNSLEISINDTKTKISNIVLEKPEFDGYSLETLDNIKQKHANLLSTIELNKKIVENAESAKETAFDKNYVSKTAEAIKERKNNIGIINSEVYKLREEMAQCMILDEVFSNGENGFKKYFINRTISMFNEKLNTFLPFFFDDDIEIKFDKDLNDTITFRGKEADFEELSSGEKTRCELCVVFALYFMVRSLFGTGTNLLVLDELADRGLDTKGILAVKQILDDISKDSSVFLVTHRDDLKETFTHALSVYKDGDGFTQIKNGA